MYGALRAGQFELLAKLATGGMGEVFLAKKTGASSFEKHVAVKLLLPHLSEQPEFVQMFLNEARIAAQMNHPNIVQVFDLGEAEGRYFLAMALVEGVSLAQLLHACRDADVWLPMPVVRAIATDLLEGLHYAHHLKDRQGRGLHIVHRDVNPSNILVSRSGRALLSDFGIAKALGSNAATSGHLRGKLAYLAPEQLSDRPVTASADLFAAAVTLYEVATRVSPFRRDSDAATLAAVQGESLPDAGALRPEVGASFAQALRRATSRDEAQRFSSARALLEALCDGPVARAQEVGEWVERLCPEALAAFDKTPHVPLGIAHTKSLIEPLSELASELASRGKRGRWLAAGTAALVGVAVAASLLGRGGLSEANRPRPEVTPASAPAAVAAAPSPSVAPQDEEEEPPVLETPQRFPALSLVQVPEVGGRRRSPTAPSRAADVGYITADAEPWAEMLVDGRVLDRTPIFRFPLRVGEHVLSFRNPELGREVQRRVTVRKGRVESIRVRLHE